MKIERIAAAVVAVVAIGCGQPGAPGDVGSVQAASIYKPGGSCLLSETACDFTHHIVYSCGKADPNSVFLTWVDPVACATDCYGSAGGTSDGPLMEHDGCNDCVAGSTQCQNGVRTQQCSPIGAWVPGSGSCECSTGDIECENDRGRSVCDVNGKWQRTASTCDCDPGDAVCDQGKMRRCDRTGRWQQSGACECTPGAWTCDGFIKKKCDDFGHWQRAGVCTLPR